MDVPEPVVVVELLPRERDALVDLLRSLQAEDWERPTVCPGWSVHDIAAHLVGDDMSRLARGRDGFSRSRRRDGEEFVAFINRQNEEWVTAWRRVSPQLIVEMLEMTGVKTQQYFAALDGFASGGAVWWATGDDPAPVWLDVAREFTERWHHQAQIRDAVGAVPLIEPAVFRPVIATFAFALPRNFRDVEAAPGTAVVLLVTGPSGGTWTVVRGVRGWDLMSGEADAPAARVSINQDDYWRLVTKGMSPRDAEPRVSVEGDPQLARHLLRTVAVIA